MALQANPIRMKRAFKHNDRVSFGLSSGIILGIFNQGQVLVWSDEERSNFWSCREMLISNPDIDYMLFYYVRDHFGYEPSADTKKLLSQRRFGIRMLSELKHTTTDVEERKLSLMKRRHMFIVMARNRIADFHDEGRLERLYGKIMDCQTEIEMLESEQKTAQDGGQS